MKKKTRRLIAGLLFSGVIIAVNGFGGLSKGRAEDRLEKLYVSGAGMERTIEQEKQMCRRAAQKTNHPDWVWFIPTDSRYVEEMTRSESNLNVEENPCYQYFWGDHYLHGNSIVQYGGRRSGDPDATKAMAWFLKAAKQEHTGAQVRIGLMYERGQGVKQDYQEAMKWFRKAADQGDALGQFNVAAMYEGAKGVGGDAFAAVKWLIDAAKGGNNDARNNLGVHFYNGSGVAQSYTDAYFWIRLASKADISEKRGQFENNREIVKRKISKEDVADINKRVDEELVKDLDRIIAVTKGEKLDKILARQRLTGVRP